MLNENIFINQIGYLEQDSKTAFSTLAGDAKLCDAASGVVVYSGKFTGSGQTDQAAGEPVYTFDFSEYKKPGQYFICPGDSKSFNFQISNEVYNQLYYSTLNYFKLSRCGNGCHTSAADIYGTNETKTIIGGWHDAGDYGRYVVAAAKTVMDLLLAYKSTKDRFSAFDILDEARFELEWMLKMQREDGGVYHKITCYHFCAFIMPEEEKDKQVISPVSTSATADLAGTFAYAAKFYADSDPAFADALIASARKAQVYLDSHEDELFINPKEITTGGYGDHNVSDERYFALCSLWAATGEENYLKAAEKIRTEQKERKPDPDKPWDRGWHIGFGWGMVSGYGTEILLENADKLKGSAILKSICCDILSQAESDLEIVKSSAFKTDVKHFGWGSNGAVCDVAHVLILAWRLSGRAEFKTAAKNQLDYILGCNPLNYCYVTGEGSKSPVNPHHRPSGASGKVMPGMVVGGPSEWLQDEYAKNHLQGSAPLKCFIDAVPSYSTNEVAIYWNSAFVYLLSQVGI